MGWNESSRRLDTTDTVCEQDTDKIRDKILRDRVGSGGSRMGYENLQSPATVMYEADYGTDRPQGDARHCHANISEIHRFDKAQQYITQFYETNLITLLSYGSTSSVLFPFLFYRKC